MVTVCVALAAGGCAQEEPADRLAGRRFLLQSAEGLPFSVEASVDLSFTDTGFLVYAGCNHLGFGYEVCGDRLCTGQRSSTAVFCGGPVGEREDRLVDFFLAEPLWTLKDDKLTLAAMDAVLVFLDRDVADPDRPLVSHRWRINTFIEGAGASTTSLPDLPTVTFERDGRFHVTTTCSSGEGVYALEAGTVTLEKVTYSEVHCSSEGSEYAHARIVDVLRDGMLEYEIDASNLRLTRGPLGLGAFAD